MSERERERERVIDSKVYRKGSSEYMVIEVKLILVPFLNQVLLVFFFSE